jgi:hypothetical protein
MVEPWPRRTISSRLPATRARRYIDRAAPTNGGSSSAAMNSTGTRRRGMAAQALTARTPRPGKAHHPGHRRTDPGRGRQRGRRAHRRADEHDPVGAASAQLLGRRDHVAFDPRPRSGSRLGVAEPFEVEGERLVAPLGERLGAGKPFAQVPAATVGEDQARRAVADHDPDQDRAGRGAEPERPGRPDVAQARLGEADRGSWRGGARSLAAPVPVVAGAASSITPRSNPARLCLPIRATSAIGPARWPPVKDT